MTMTASATGRARQGAPTAVRRQLAGDEAWLRPARSLVGDVLKAALPDVRDTAVLLTGELVTNALVHGGGWFFLQVEAGTGWVRVEVTDTTTARPHLVRGAEERAHGRGLAIVDALASRWGTDHHGTHKAVWFELSSSVPA